jgi:vacuolar-type H+-ATPase subunit E/Vma4
MKSLEEVISYIEKHAANEVERISSEYATDFFKRLNNEDFKQEKEFESLRLKKESIDMAVSAINNILGGIK